MKLIFTKRKVIILLCLYAFTWIGGYYAHTIELKQRAENLYNNAKLQERIKAERYKELNLPEPEPITRANCPISRVNWCIPILPGVLIADSEVIIGPLYAQGGPKIVFFYVTDCASFIIRSLDWVS